MTAIKVTELSRFMSKPDPGIKAVLIYGPDTGAINENARNLVKAVAGALDDPFTVIRLNDAALSEDSSRLADEAQAISMMGGRRVIWISGAGTGFQKSITDYLPHADTDSLIVAEAGELQKSNKIRSLFENAKNAYAVPCYQDTKQNLYDVVAKSLAEHGMTITPDAHHHLCEMLGSDRLLTRSELEKLTAYCAGQETVSIDDVNAVCGDTSEHSIDDMVDAVFVGEAAIACSHFSRLLNSGIATTRMLSSAALHIARLQALALALDGGRNASMVVKSARPPIFFRRQSAVIRQLGIWQFRDLEAAEQTLQSTIAQTRQYPALEPEIAERALLSLARNAQANRLNNA